LGLQGQGQGQGQRESVRANEDVLLAVRDLKLKWLLIAVNNNKLANSTHNSIALQNEVRRESSNGDVSWAIWESNRKQHAKSLILKGKSLALFSFILVKTYHK
jgi:hypothetical protein